MKALTLIRPWPTLIWLGKNIENRRWPCPLPIGEVFAIHAGRKWDKSGLTMAMKLGLEISPEPEDHPTGIIGTVKYLGHRTTKFSPWCIEGNYHWHIKPEIKLTAVIDCKGAQGLWTIADDDLVRLKVDGKTG